MDDTWIDALRISAIIFGSLIAVACTFTGSIIIMNRVVLFKEKHSGFKFHCRPKRIKKDDKRKILIAAAVAAYLKAEEEGRNS